MVSRSKSWNRATRVVFGYEQLPTDSIFHPRATARFVAVRDAWLQPVLQRAEKHAERRRCADIDATPRLPGWFTAGTGSGLAD